MRTATFVRYTAFIPIYPLGLAAELAVLWHALPAMDVHSPFDLAGVFHQASFERIVLVLQPILWAQLYNTLLRQRAKRLDGPRNKTE